MKWFAVLAGLFSLALNSPMPVKADTYNFYPSTTTGSPGVNLAVTSKAFGSTPPGAPTITASGWMCSGATTPCFGVAGNTATDLAWKNYGSGSEAGLGLTQDPDGMYEISDDDFISLDMSKLHVTSGILEISSGQTGQYFDICFSSSANVLGPTATCLTHLSGGASGLAKIPVSWDSSHPYVQVTGYTNDYGKPEPNSNDDVLIESFSTVPEPNTLSLFATGLLSVGGLFLFRKTSCGRPT